MEGTERASTQRRRETEAASHVRRCRRACAASDRLTPENTSHPTLNTWLVFSGVSRSHGPAHGRAGIGCSVATGNEPPLLRFSELKLVPFSPSPPSPELRPLNSVPNFVPDFVVNGSCAIVSRVFEVPDLPSQRPCPVNTLRAALPHRFRSRLPGGSPSPRVLRPSSRQLTTTNRGLATGTHD